jgi:3,4-dihydroxy-2-butanone 4-phosphate synthase/GTP cyclohydrolase II
MKTHMGTLRQVFDTRIPTRWGTFRALGFEREIVNGSRRTETAIALILGDLVDGTPLVRVHSQCFTSEVLGSLRCDCQDQLGIAMQLISNEGRGLVIYEHQEGRGIGLMAKLQAYALQDLGLDTIDANYALGFDADCRDFHLPVEILKSLQVDCVRLLTNNPQKVRAMRDAGIVVVQIACETAPTSHSFAYLATKKDRMGHTLTLGGHSRPGAVHFRDCHHSLQLANIHSMTETTSPIATVDATLDALRSGRMIVVVDDEDRENEGDLVIAADAITPEAVNFMATYGKGLICLAMTDELLDELDLPSMVTENSALGGTAFTASIDFQGPGITTGISAQDRARTIQAAVDPNSCPADFAVPGHVFPLRARPGGVLERRGHTEAAVDLARLAGLSHAGVICEILNDDGSMARGPDLFQFCRKHGLLMMTVAELANYRLNAEFDELISISSGVLCA